MKKRFVPALLVLALALSLAAPALAYSTPDFSDVPSSHWAYESVMKMADAGVIKGVGEGRFAPADTLTAEMFIVLVGRVVFPEVKAEGADWSGPYVSEAKSQGLLAGTNVTDGNLKGEISRYDMAVILAKCVEILKVSATKADSSKVTDYGEVPAKYVDAVLMAYGSGLIRGDQSGSFNGANSMTRQEAATVMDRLLGLKGNGSQGEITDPQPTPGPEQPEKPKPVDPLEPEIIPMPDGEKMVSRIVLLRVLKADHVIGRPVDTKRTFIPDVPVKLYYTPDGGKTAVLISEFKSPSQEEYNKNLDWDIVITFDAPESWSSAENYENGNGFFFSAETVLDGQRLVTSDLRTDGRAYPDIQRISPVSDPSRPVQYDIELTPPHGEKAKFTFQGYVEWSSVTGDRLANFTIRLYLADGTLVAEAVSRADGTFSMDCEVDALDGGFDRTSKLYYYTASGYINGVRYEDNAISPTSGNLMLESLVRLQAVDEVKAGPPLHQNYRVLITPKYRADG